MTSSISCPVCQRVLGVDEWRALEKGKLTACPSCGSPMDAVPSSGSDDTGAFQRFYSGGATGQKHGLFRRFVDWWRDRVKGVSAG